MAVFQIESGVAHGRGFSSQDANGVLAKFLSWAKRPVADGSPQEFTATAATDVCACTGHGYATGDSVKLTTTTTLPAGLALLTEYFIIKVDDNSFKLATTHANAKAGTQIDITDTGTGTHSVYALGGGPAWFLYDDLTTLAAQTFATTDVDTSTEQITVTAHGMGTGHAVVVTSSDTVPAGLTSGTEYYVIRVDANTIKLANSLSNARAGTAINITSQGAGTHTLTKRDPYAVFCDIAAPAVNDYNTGASGGAPKFVKVSMKTTEAGYIRMQFYHWWNSTTHYGQGLWAGYRLNTYDDADFAYDFRGGAECMITQTRLGTTWYTAVWDEWTGDANLVEGTDKVGTLQSGVTAGSSVVLQLDTGEAANFTVGKDYYLFDFVDHTWLTYVTVTARDLGADQITIDYIAQNFPAGSVIAAYAHRWFAMGSGTEDLEGISYTSYYSKLPYYSGATGYEIHNQSGAIYGIAKVCVADEYLSAMNPNDEEYYAVQRPGIVEYFRPNELYTAETGMNRGYGVLKNCYWTYNTSLAAAQDGRTVNSKNYLFFKTSAAITYSGSSAHAVLFLDTEAAS